MKKSAALIKPYVSIIFGTLLFLYYLNWLSLSGTGLAIGIIATVLSVYYLAAGILGVILGEKFGPGLKKGFDIASIVSFPTFFFVLLLILTIDGADSMGPTGWVISILGMIASLAAALIYLLAKLIDNEVLKKLSYLFAAIFVLAMLLNVLFDIAGNPVALGFIDVLAVVIYALFAYMLFLSLPRKEKAQEEEKE